MYSIYSYVYYEVTWHSIKMPKVTFQVYKYCVYTSISTLNLFEQSVAYFAITRKLNLLITYTYTDTHTHTPID